MFADSFVTADMAFLFEQRWVFLALTLIASYRDAEIPKISKAVCKRSVYGKGKTL